MKKPISISIILLGILLAVSTRIYSQTTTNKTMELNTTTTTVSTHQIFIDKFVVPQSAKHEFTERMNVNRNFIKTLSGFIEDNAYERLDEQGNSIIVTVAIWENESAIKNAKEAVQGLYRKEGFDMQGFLKRLNISIDRGVYKQAAN